MSVPPIRKGTQARIYNKHIRTLQQVTAKIDNKAPRLPVGVYVKASGFYGDIFRLKNVEQQNQELLKQINIIYRTKGKEDCQLEKYGRQKTVYSAQLKAQKKIQERNAKFLEKLDLKNMKSHYSQEDSLKDWKKILKIMKFSAKYPGFYENKRPYLDTWSLCPKNITTDPQTHQVCYLNLKIGDLPRLCRLEIEVFNDIVPATAANFIGLCQGFADLSYRDSIFHRIVPGLLCIGGDNVNHSGTGGLSIYGPSFPDENFTLVHNGPGVVAMYSSQPDNNNSQFLITFKKLSTLNGKYVVIGRVISSYKILRLIESCGTKGGKPLQTVKVVDCGVRV